MFTYSEKALDHFRHPRNVGIVSDPDAVGEVGSLACGQMLRIAFRLDERKRIAEVRFQAFGCASAIAALSALTELVKGLTPDEAAALTNRDVCRYLDGLPEAREFCSDLGVEALQAAVNQYRRRQDAPTPDQPPPSAVLDCRGLACPLNYVKTKIQLDRMAAGDTLHVLLNAEGARNVPISARAEGHAVLTVVPQDDHWRVVIQRGA